MLAILSRHFLRKLCALLCFLGVLRYLCVLFLYKNLFLKKRTVSIPSTTGVTDDIHDVTKKNLSLDSKFANSKNF